MSHTVRAYAPATFPRLATLRERGELPGGPAYAVTPELRARLREDDQEVLEYAAFELAGRASLELLRTDPAAPRRRVVVAVDAPVEREPDGQVRLVGPVPLAAVAAIHVDSAAAEPVVSTALADGSDPDEVLEWYDPSELGALLGSTA